MFSHLCRACLTLFNDNSDIVPLFESYQNVFYYQICNSLQLSNLESDDNMGRYVCKNCAENLMSFYNFRLMYIESERKLREIFEQSNDSSNKTVNSTDIEPELGNIVLTTLGKHESQWKCKKCSAGFKSRKILREHAKQHRIKSVDVELSGTTKNDSDQSSSEEWGCKSALNDFPPVNALECVKTEIGNDCNDNGTESRWKEDNESFPDRDLLSGNKQQENNAKEHDIAQSTGLTQISIKQESTKYDEISEVGYALQPDITALTSNAHDRWKCTICFSVFKSRDQLRIHRRTHAGVRRVINMKKPESTSPDDSPRWRCPICQDLFRTREELQNHRRTIHPYQRAPRSGGGVDLDETGQEYTCSICNKIFLLKSKLRKHMDVHKYKDSKRRLCTICGISLCSTYNLNTHVRNVHGGERNFKCTQCDRRFTHSHHLKSHMNKHEGIRPFACELCVKSFYDKVSLRAHVKSVHVNLKEHICPICLKGFNRAGNLRTHMAKTHHLEQQKSVNLLQNFKTDNTISLV